MSEQTPNPDTLLALFARSVKQKFTLGELEIAFELHADAWKADREWKRAYDEGEAVGMRSNTTDAENPYPAGSHSYCGWSFGFWGSRNASLRKALEAEVAGLRRACRNLVDDVHEAYPEGLRPGLGPVADIIEGIERLLPPADNASYPEGDSGEEEV